MSKWISNIQIKNAIKNIEDEDLNDNFVGLFSSNHMNKFINHAVMISEKQGKYPFVIANADTSEKGGTHWWSILDIEPKTDIFFFIFYYMVWNISSYGTIEISNKSCLGQKKWLGLTVKSLFLIYG